MQKFSKWQATSGYSPWPSCLPLVLVVILALVTVRLVHFYVKNVVFAYNDLLSKKYYSSSLFKTFISVTLCHPSRGILTFLLPMRLRIFSADLVDTRSTGMFTSRQSRGSSCDAKPPSRIPPTRTPQKANFSSQLPSSAIMTPIAFVSLSINH